MRIVIATLVAVLWGCSGAAASSAGGGSASSGGGTASTGGGSGASGGGTSSNGGGASASGGGASSSGGGTTASGGGGSAAGGGSSSSGGGNPCGALVGSDAGVNDRSTLFDKPVPWTEDVCAQSAASQSPSIIAGLVDAGGWGQGNQFLTDVSIEVLLADGGTPTRDFTPTTDFYKPDCDQVPLPIPAGGAIEGETGYACTHNGDCHLLVIQSAGKKLYEMWRANITGTSLAQFRGGCAAAWDLSASWGPLLRGKGCSSADAAGFPITAMLANADEVYSGEVRHALRFILPNDRIRDGVYVPPSTHSTGPTLGGPSTPPYGVRFRLKASFDESKLTTQAGRVLARALKRYGMFLADGGNIALTLQSDRSTTHKWSEVGLTNNRALAALAVSDFEVVEYGTETNWKAQTDCTRIQ